MRQLTEEQVVIIENLQRWIKLRDGLTYGDLSRSDISSFYLNSVSINYLFCIVFMCWMLMYNFPVWNKPVNLDISNPDALVSVFLSP